MSKILVITVAPDISDVSEETFNALRNMDKGNNTVEWFVSCRNISGGTQQNVGYNMNRAMKLAEREDYDYVYVLESDVVPPEDTLTTLLSQKGDVREGIGPERPSKVGTNEWNVVYNKKRNKGAKEKIENNEPFKISGKKGWIGTALIPRRVFEERKVQKSGRQDGQWHLDVAEKFDIVVDPSVKTIHIDNGKYIQGPNDNRDVKEVLSNER